MKGALVLKVYSVETVKVQPAVPQYYAVLFVSRFFETLSRAAMALVEVQTASTVSLYLAHVVLCVFLALQAGQRGEKQLLHER